jgi:uncharacterized damage-inducible protein DinB
MTIQEILQELDAESAATRRALARVRDEKLDWRPHEKSLSLGQLAYHIAAIPGRIAEVAMQDTFVAGPVPRPSVGSSAEALSLLEQSLARATELISALSDDDLGRPWRMVIGDQQAVLPRGAVIRSVLLNHWYHHRGQLTVYLRQTEASVPSVYGPSADEMPELG